MSKVRRAASSAKPRPRAPAGDAAPLSGSIADPATRLDVEWLRTNGLGGYAMGSLPGVNTRRYHGLLIAAATPPVGRIVALQCMIEELVVGKQVTPLSTQQFGPELVLHPEGHTRLVGVDWPAANAMAWRYEFDGVSVQRKLMIHGGRNAAELTYDIRGLTQPAKLRLRPFTPLRDFHSLLREPQHGHDAPKLQASRSKAIISREGISLTLEGFGVAFIPGAQWWHNFAYAQDRYRGQEWIEDSWSPGVFEFDVNPGRCELTLRAEFTSLQTSDASMPTRTFTPRAGAAALRQLQEAASHFVVRRRLGDRWSSSVIAGYPWFGDWGRDTMISLPGLMLCTGRLEEARQTLLTFAGSMKNGLIPNLFDDYGGAEHYNTVDASLWFIHAVHALWSWPTSDTGRKSHFAELVAACRRVVAAYRDGTDFGIRMDRADGLISAGDPNSQLTWMDAKRDGVAFTPRFGKPVEINALWHHALHCVAQMHPPESRDLLAMARQVRETFGRAYWWPEQLCLHDVLEPQGDGTWRGDGRLRPNQIFAVSLRDDLLPIWQRKSVLEIVKRRLLTPVGLRTLAPEDPKYRGRYEGNLFDRDSAYHNGTVWPWLIGPFAEAVLRIGGFSVVAREEAARLIRPLLAEMACERSPGCVGQIAEVYDGDAPHRPSGCPAQAWSVAEVLRIATLIESAKR